MKPYGKKKAGSQKLTGGPSVSHFARNSTLSIKSATHELRDLREG
jgi:hypothetical protein